MDKKLLYTSARRASGLLKALANVNRLLILCSLAESEKSVSELEAIFGIRQPTLSQQLARLRADELVTTRRISKSVFYSLSSREAARVIELLYAMFCGPGARKGRSPPAARRKGRRNAKPAAAGSGRTPPSPAL